jgi:hypothetical protein
VTELQSRAEEMASTYTCTPKSVHKNEKYFLRFCILWKIFATSRPVLRHVGGE